MRIQVKYQELQKLSKMNTKHTVIQGDSHQMNELADKSVHLVVTSPKIGLTEVDDSLEFKYKNKFLGI
ncbi:hypothetical protein FACS1894178_4320 [Bacteroidia bacterium]|nr:hypothetical protein FACS1894178_4320 [Bacteroidia bacterium]